MRFRPSYLSSLQYSGIALAVLLTGCGGGAGSGIAGGGGNGGGNGGGGGATNNSTATTFQVDVKTGKVSVVGPSAATAGVVRPHAIFAGDSIGFNSSELLNLADAEAGVRTLNVSIKNNFGLPIGKNVDGSAGTLRVLFGNFTNLTGLGNLRPFIDVTTVAGTGSPGNTDGPATSATFTAPLGIAVNNAGDIFVTDTTGHNIRKISKGTVSTFAGGGTAAANGIGTVAGFRQPYGMAFNPVDGALIVADFGENRVRRITPTGLVSTIGGSATASSVDGPGNTATFNQPAGVAVDSSGIIYVSDFAGNKIRKITFTGGDATLPANYSVSTLCGSGVAGSADGTGTAATFTSPIGLCLDGEGGLLIADTTSYKIRRVDTSTATVVTIAGTGVAGLTDGVGNVAQVNGTRALVKIGSTFVFSDYTSGTIRELNKIPGATPYSATSWTVQTLAGGGNSYADGSGTSALFNGPAMIAASGSNAIYIADRANRRVRKLNGTNGIFPIGTLGGGAGTTPVRLSNPTGLVAQNQFGANMPYIDYAGPLDSGATSPSQYWSFVIPTNVDAFQFSVMVEAGTPVLSPPASSNAIVSTLTGVTNLTGFNDGPVAQARMGLVKYADHDAAGNFYFTDLSNNALRRISTSGMVSTIAGGPGNVSSTADGLGNTAKISSINAVAVAPDGTHVFFGDGNYVRVATLFGQDPSNAGGWLISTIAGSVSAGQANGLGSVATFNTIEDFAFDSGNLYISCYFGNTIRKMTYKGGDIATPNNWVVSTWAGDDSATSGASGNTDSTGTSARFYNPRGIDVDKAGNVYVADQSNFTIRKISPNQVVTTIAGSGVQGYGDGVGTAAEVKFSLPYGISVDSSGYLYLGDIGSYTVRRIAPDGTVTTVAGQNGVSGGADGPWGTNSFVRPAGTMTTPGGDLWVCDQSSIRKVQRLIKGTGN